MEKKYKFLIAVAVQVLIIFVIIIFKYSVIAGGVDVMLRVQPVDPRDPLRGDYVTFSYNISTLNKYMAAGSQLKSGDTVYVTLKEGRTYWSATKVSKQKPDYSENIFIKGKVTSTGSSVRIIYGVEEYFIPEETGWGFSFANKFSTAKVSVDKEGNSVLKQIYVDGDPWP